MRFVPRPPQAPKSLAGPAFTRMRTAYLAWLRLEPRARAQTRPPDRGLPPTPELLDALAVLFDHKCAFCERKVTLQLFRFRPPSEALPFANTEGTLAYGWLADSWQNLLPICADCLPHPRNAFPVAGRRAALPSATLYADYVQAGTGVWPRAPAEDESGLAEEPLLLDPTFDADLEAHLRARPDGYWEGLSPRGLETLRLYRLNRPDLVAARARAVTALGDALGASSTKPPQTSEFAGFLANLARRQTPDRLPPQAPESFAIKTKAPWPSAAPERATAPGYALPPALVKVEIKGFKGIERLDLDLPAPAPFDAPAAARLILGENSAGKSSLLEAIALTLAPPAARAALDLDPAALLLDPAQMGSARAARKTGLVRLTFQDATGGAESRVMLRLTRRGLETDGHLPEGLPVFAYGAYRHYVKASHDWAPERGIVTLFRSDNLLSNPGKWLEILPEARFDEVVQALRFIFGPGGGFARIARDARGCMVVTSPDPNDPAAGERFTPLDAVSSGFRTMLALTCDVMRWLIDPAAPGHFPSLKSARGLLLVDEIEAHLHPRWKVQVMAGLRRALPGMTLIATTHDPLCLRGMQDGEVLVLRRIPGIEAGSHLPMKVDALTTLPDVGKLTIEQLLKSDFFALYDTDDPQTGSSLAELADALAGLDTTDPARAAQQEALLARFRAEVTGALPVGPSAVAMLVQEAVADYLRAQRHLTDSRRRALRDATKARIVAILKGGQNAPG
ncbi:AAA family ATPase [Rhodobacter sp. TJ_12]|uniref:AAA family ATPase n=1 Tax=Rhodobacter sp. TJ_12 TaxID=2029399 RepID=UPI001CBB374D|nr:AAA family ATPase [Rhodobacter sp. TJ_12]